MENILSAQMIMGNQAIALGALCAGVNLAAGYPGTPSSEIIEFIAKYRKETGAYVEWSVNEKAAVEVAAGTSYAGGKNPRHNEAGGTQCCERPGDVPFLRGSQGRHGDCLGR